MVMTMIIVIVMVMQQCITYRSTYWKSTDMAFQKYATLPQFWFKTIREKNIKQLMKPWRNRYKSWKQRWTPMEKQWKPARNRWTLWKRMRNSAMRYFSCLAPKRIKTQQTTHFGFEMQEIARKNLPSSSNDIFLLQNAAWFFWIPVVFWIQCTNGTTSALSTFSFLSCFFWCSACLPRPMAQK